VSSERPALRPVANDPSEIVAIPQQFMFEHKSARRVAIVGDFNNWDPKANAMVRDASGLWSTILPIMPGRHLFGFMVDDSVFMLDPHKPKARDPDLGSEGSVLMVGRP
jgi:1,4-alpha-glucan branching enzyme